MHLNEEFLEWNWQVDVAKAVKAEWQWEWMTDEQAKKSRCAAAEEKAKRDWQEQLAELAWVNHEVSPNFAFQYLT